MIKLIHPKKFRITPLYLHKSEGHKEGGFEKAPTIDEAASKLMTIEKTTYKMRHFLCLAKLKIIIITNNVAITSIDAVGPMACSPIETFQIPIAFQTMHNNRYVN